MQKIAILTLAVIAQARIEAYMPINPNGTAAADTDIPLGFTAASADANEGVAVDVLGTTIAFTGAAIKAGDALKLSSGAVVPGTDEDIIVARALTAAVAGEKTEILLLPRAV